MPEALLNDHLHHWHEAGRGDEVLVLLHGSAGSGKAFDEHVGPLGEFFRLVIPDMRGLGQSARVTTAPHSAWVEDLRALQDHLELGPMNVYGVTVGGRVAMRFAVESPERITSLIVDAPVLFNQPDAQGGVATQVNVAAMPRERRNQLQRLHGDGWQQAADFYATYRSLQSWQEYYDLRHDSRSIQTPTLIMRGDTPGKTYSAEHAFMLYRNVPGAWMWIRPNTPSSLLKHAPGEAYKVITSFIQSSMDDSF